jgi:cytochrome oxidase Cu insertion factor (SCO1/SenC/PrrC family)
MPYPLICRCLARTLLAAISLLLAPVCRADVLHGLQLLDQGAALVNSATVARRVVLLNFVFTHCASTCPMQVRELAALHDAMEPDVRARVHFLSVSVDPLNDTPASLAAYARRMGAQRPGWTFATGAPGQVQSLVQRMQAMDSRRPSPRPQDHRTSLYLFDASGELVQRFAGVPIDRPRLIAEITRLARKPSPAAQ